MVAQNGGTGFTGTQLFRQLWDTQNPAPGQADLPGSAALHRQRQHAQRLPLRLPPEPRARRRGPTHALHQLLRGGGPLQPLRPGARGRLRLRRVPHRLRRRQPGVAAGRNFIIFEAVLPNPRPDLGLEGCRPVAELLVRPDRRPGRRPRAPPSWRTSTSSGCPASRRWSTCNNYGFNARGLGQVRTNQFIRAGPWHAARVQAAAPVPAPRRRVHAEVRPGDGEDQPLRRGCSTRPPRTRWRPPSRRALRHPGGGAWRSTTSTPSTTRCRIPSTPARATRRRRARADDYVAQFGPGPSAFHSQHPGGAHPAGQPADARATSSPAPRRSPAAAATSAATAGSWAGG